MARAIDGDVLFCKFWSLADPYVEQEKTYPWQIWNQAATMAREAPTITPSNKWISVEERRPEKHTCVLTYCDDGHIEIDAILSNGEWARTPFDPGEVTHWMPLPDPPNGKEAPHE